LADLTRRRFAAADIRVEADMAGALDQTGATNPDIAIVVINAAGPAAVAALPALVARIAPCPVVVLDDRFDRTRFAAAIAADAKGYVPLTSNRDLIDAAIGLVAAGGVHFHAPADQGRRGGLEASLSSRQLDVLRGVAAGKTNREISDDLGITVATVKLHVHAILTAIGARNRTEAAILAHEEGLSETRGDLLIPA
jgi:DNA-binding NarL/FixJ family response regulator